MANVDNYFQQPAENGSNTDNKLIIDGTMDITGTWKINGTSITVTASQLNNLDGATLTTTELNTR